MKCCSTGIRWIWVAVLVLILDRITKLLAMKYLFAYTPLEVSSFFNLTLAFNTGAAFSFLAKYSGWQSWLLGGVSVVVSAGLLIWLSRLAATQRWVSVALSLIVGGALGNLSDRLMYGHVIDFLEFHAGHLYWPAFNVADSAICVGAVMLVLDAFFGSKKK